MSERDQKHRLLLIICSALVAGATLMGIISCFLASRDGGELKLDLFTLVGGVIAINGLVMSVLLPNLILSQGVRQGNEPGAIVQNCFIIRMAMLEGSALFLFVITIVEKNFLPAILGFVLVAVMVLMLPYRPRFDGWWERASQKS